MTIPKTDAPDKHPVIRQRPFLPSDWFRVGPAKIHCPGCRSLRTFYVEGTRIGLRYGCDCRDHRWQ